MGSSEKGYDKIMSNDVKLQEGHPVDENLRPIKVGGKATALETAQHGNGARVNGDLEVTGDIKGNVKDVELDLTTINSTDLTIDDAGDITLDAAGRNVFIAENGTNKFKYDTYLNTFEIFSTDNASDIFKIDVNAEGATTLSTTDADTTVGHLTMDVDGAIISDSHSGKFLSKKAGTEFSAANSSYAGMILGCTYIRNATDSSGKGQILISGTTWMLVDSVAGTPTVAGVVFTAPPSGNVEIVFDALSSNSNDYLELALSSDRSSYTSVHADHEYDYPPVYFDESDRHTTKITWIVTGLTAGTSYDYSIWARTNGSGNRHTFLHGVQWSFSGDATQAPPIVVKAIALPETLVTGE